MARKQRDASDETYPEEETARRFEAALRGAQKVGHKPLSEVPRKRRQADRTAKGSQER